MPPNDTTDATWQAAIDDLRRSGLTQAEFCPRRGLSLHTFRRHLYRRPDPSSAPATAQAPPVADPTPPAHPRFLPVTLLADPPPVTSPDPLVLILRDGRRIAVAAGFEEDTLRRLIDAIEARP